MAQEAGLVFDAVAESYELARPGYPAELFDAACAQLGLEPGSSVVEVGCGTGKLTRDLVRRGLAVVAIDPGAELVSVARRQTEETSVRFHVASFEDVGLPSSSFDAVFSATAFHWVDPNVGWRKAASLLRPGGGLALFTHTVELPSELLSAWRDVLPEAATWVSRDPVTLWNGARERQNNISDLWAWLTKCDLSRPEAGELFEPSVIETVAMEKTMTADGLIALIRTQSSYLQLDADRRAQLEERVAAAVAATGGVHRAETLAVLATTRLRT